MKPDWKDAPEWAQWLAMDEDGEWRWHARVPVTHRGRWLSGGMVRHASYQDVSRWDETEERRPDTTKPAEAGSEGQEERGDGN